MRKSLCASVAVCVLCVAAPAWAGEEPSGFVDIRYSESDIADVNVDTFAIGGSVAVNGAERYSTSTWGVQGDLDVATTEIFDEDTTAVEFGGHVFSRSQGGLFGAYLGYANADNDGPDSDAWTAGLEGLNFYDNTSVYGSVGYAKLNDTDSDGWTAALEVRYFLEPNFRIDLHTSILDGQFPVDDGTLWSIGFGAEYQIGASPVSVFGGFDHTEFDNDVFDFSGDAVTIGLRWNFQGNLLSRDRNGAALPKATAVTRSLGGI